MNRDREQWLAERRTGIGSSDAAAVCNLSPWGTPLSVYLDKLGQLPERHSPAMDWGTRLEPVLARAYEEVTGRALLQTNLLRHPEHPWMVANLDRLHLPGAVIDPPDYGFALVPLPSADGRIVELKTCNAFAADEWGEPGTDEVPEPYLIQVQHQMAVTGISVADVAVLIGGSDFRIYTVPRNDSFIARLVEIEAAFWQMVQSRIPPAPTWEHATTPDVVASLYSPEGGSITLDWEAATAVNEYQALGEQERSLSERRKVLRAKLIERMGTAALGLLPDGQRIVRKWVTRRGYSVEPGGYFSFTVKEAKS